MISTRALLVGLLAAHANGFALSLGPMDVRVRLQRQAKVYQFTGQGLTVKVGAEIVNASTQSPHAQAARIVYAGPGQWLVNWQTASGVVQQRLHSDRLVVRGLLLRANGDPAPYEVELYDSRASGADLVARMDLDRYLMGVLPAEMPLAWPVEALKAQAVAARSFAVRSALDRRERHFDIDSTITDQVYRYLDAGASRPEWRGKLERAVRETRGEVLLDGRKRVLRAFYSADCGCRTEDPRFVWGAAVDAVTSVIDPSCRERSPANWRIELSRTDVRQRLGSVLGTAPGRLKALHIAGRTPSGRVAKVIASTDEAGGARTVEIDSQSFRRIMGYDRIRSTDFSLAWTGDRLEIKGTGIGHGVGMCQSGAKTLADRGMGYREILKVYFPKAELWTDRRSKT